MTQRNNVVAVKLELNVLGIVIPGDMRVLARKSDKGWFVKCHKNQHLKFCYFYIVRLHLVSLA